MNESILKALMKLFAIIANVDENGVSKRAITIVESYLLLMLNRKNIDEYLELFHKYVKKYHKIGERNSVKVRKRTSVNSVKVLMICNEINEELDQKEKIIVMIRLLEFISEDNNITVDELEFVNTVADVFNIKREEYQEIKQFILHKEETNINNPERLLYINDGSKKINNAKQLTCQNLNGDIVILFIESNNTFIFKYTGKNTLFLNSQDIKPNRVYVLNPGALIKGQRITPIYQSDVVRTFIHSQSKTKIKFEAQNVEYSYPGSKNGIKELIFKAESGNLIGIMGGSGVGKSTLLNLINGNLPPDKGTIRINGHDIYKNPNHTKGIIGFVPQDDLLIEELTVYQNLYFNAELCFNKLSEEEIHKRVEKILTDLELISAKDLKVGSPLNKTISGGQRKRLNIALELIREPIILIVDEPTSGLSSMDSETVMTLLKTQSLQGKLVIVNIHQPSSEIYKLFDKLLILDKGGYPVYQGNPVNALSYFKRQANYVNAEDSECITCGNVETDLPLKILEARQVDQFGKLTKERKISAKEWNSLYKKNITLKESEPDEKHEIPENNFSIPGKFKQFLIFTKRNILSKLTDKQYLLITFLEAPLLAVILGYFSKYISGKGNDPSVYIFAENINIPAYIFMAVTVALFIGLTLSAEEIIKDKKILKREKFLNLSRFSYINSKIFVLLIISAIQMFSFVVIGNMILEIKGMTFTYWIVLFSAAAFANILGLNISASLKSVVTIYITIPFILVPQLLLSGVIIDFTKLHKNFTSYEYVPVIGDIMTSRWAYEAMTVAQYKHNDYQKHFFENDMKKSIFKYKVSYLIPKLNELLTSIQKNPNKDNSTSYRLLKDGFSNLYTNKAEKEPFFEKIKNKNMTVADIKNAKSFLDEEKRIYNNALKKIRHRNNIIFNNLVKELGSKEKVYDLKEQYYNKQVEQFVQNKNEFSAFKITENKIIQLKDPIYTIPKAKNGRAHFYAPYKRIGNLNIDTTVFNIIFIWLTSLGLYLLLNFNILEKILKSFNKKHDLS